MTNTDKYVDQIFGLSWAEKLVVRILFLVGAIVGISAAFGILLYTFEIIRL